MSLRFTLTGGGELFLAATTCNKVSLPASLPVPSSTFNPPAQSNLKGNLEIVGGNSEHIYAPGGAISWTVRASGSVTGRTFSYHVYDETGAFNILGTGSLNTPIVLTNAQPGFYRMDISGAVTLDQGITYGLAQQSRAMVVASPTAWAYGRNPFGIKSESVPNLMSRLGFSWTRPLTYNLSSPGYPDPYFKVLPTNLTAYAAAVESFMTNSGTIAALSGPWNQTLEIWNEPYNDVEKIEGGIAVHRVFDAVAKDEFFSLLATTKDKLNAMNSHTKLAVGTDGAFTKTCYDPNGNPGHCNPPNIWEPQRLVFFRDIEKAGFRDKYDIAVLHPYSGGGDAIDLPPEKHDVSLSGGLIEYIKVATQYINPQGLPRKEIYSTEFGWTTNPAMPYHVTEKLQAEYLVRSSLLQLSQGMAKIMPHHFDDIEGDGIFGATGLRTLEKYPKPSLLSYSVMAQAIDNLPYQGRFKTTGSADANTALLLFGNETKSVLVVWNPTNTVAFKHAVLSDSRLVSSQVKSLYGKTIPANSAFNIHSAPTYVIMGCSKDAVIQVGRERTFVNGNLTFISKDSPENSEDYFTMP